MKNQLTLVWSHLSQDSILPGERESLTSEADASNFPITGSNELLAGRKAKPLEGERDQL